jgi:hypothetical protein
MRRVGASVRHKIFQFFFITMEVKEFLKKPLEGRSVRVSIPASVANDLDLFKRSIADLLGKLGCTECFSGADCRFDIIRDWVISEKGEANFYNASGAIARDRDDAFGIGEKAASISAQIHPSAANNIRSVFSAIDQIGKNIGCTPCHSGYDLEFRNAIRYLNINEQAVVGIR